MKKIFLDEQAIKTSYDELKSCYRVAKAFGVSYSSIYSRLKKFDIPVKVRRYSKDEELMIVSFYNKGFARDGKSLKAFCEKLGRSVWSVCRFAREKSLTSIHRKKRENSH